MDTKGFAATALALMASGLKLPAKFLNAHRAAPAMTRRRRARWGSKNPVPLVRCRACGKHVADSPRRTHICVAPYIPSPPHGYRYERGELVRRKQS